MVTHCDGPTASSAVQTQCDSVGAGTFTIRFGIAAPPPAPPPPKYQVGYRPSHLAARLLDLQLLHLNQQRVLVKPMLSCDSTCTASFFSEVPVVASLVQSRVTGVRFTFTSRTSAIHDPSSLARPV